MKTLADVLEEGKDLSWGSHESLPSLYSLRVQARSGKLNPIDHGTTTILRSSCKSLLLLTLSGGHLSKPIGALAHEAAHCAFDVADGFKERPCLYADRLFSWLREQMSDGRLLYRCLSDVMLGMPIENGKIWLLRVGANCAYSTQGESLRLVTEDSRQVVLEARGEWPKLPIESVMTRLVDNTLSPLSLGAEKGFQSILLPLAPLVLLGRGLIPFHPLPMQLRSIEELAAQEAGWRHGLTGAGALVGFTSLPGAPFEVTRLAWGE